MDKAGLWYHFRVDPMKLYALVEKFVGTGLTAKEIGKRLGVSRECIVEYLSKWGLSCVGRRGPKKKSFVKKRSVAMRLYRGRKIMKEWLKEIGFWELPYIIFDMKGQPHISKMLTLRSLTPLEGDQEQWILAADRLTGEKVSAYVRKSQLEEQRKNLVKE